MQVEMEKEVRKLKEENKSSYFELFFTVSQFYLSRFTRNTHRTGVNIEYDLQLNEACLKPVAEELGEVPENAVTNIKIIICSNISVMFPVEKITRRAKSCQY